MHIIPATISDQVRPILNGWQATHLLRDALALDTHATYAFFLLSPCGYSLHTQRSTVRASMHSSHRLLACPRSF